MKPLTKSKKHYTKLTLAAKIKNHVLKNFEVEEIFTFPQPIPYTYTGKVVKITMIQRHEYFYGHFTKKFKTIWVQLDNGEFVRLKELGTKHLIPIYQYLDACPKK